MRRLAIALVCALSTLTVVPVAYADHGPTVANDEFASATVVSGLPFTDVSSTVDAHPAADDPTDCNASGNSIWYSFTPSSDMILSADTFDSNFDTVLSAHTRDQDMWQSAGCNDDSAGSTRSQFYVFATAGVTYYFKVAGYFGNVGGTVFNLAPADILTSMAVDVERTTVDRTGQVMVHGTITCSHPADGGIQLFLDQSNARFSARSEAVIYVSCSPTPTAWSITLTSNTGVQFVPGRVDLRYAAWAYGNPIGSASTEGSESLKLRRLN